MARPNSPDMPPKRSLFNCDSEPFLFFCSDEYLTSDGVADVKLSLDGVTDMTQRGLIAWLISHTEGWWRDWYRTQRVDGVTDITQRGLMAWLMSRIGAWLDIALGVNNGKTVKVVLRWVLITAKRHILFMKVITDMTCGYYPASFNKLSFAWSSLVSFSWPTRFLISCFQFIFKKYPATMEFPSTVCCNLTKMQIFRLY